MTKREYLDMLLAACDDGTFPSVSQELWGSKCAYRGGKLPQKCAAGVLIPDDVWARVSNRFNDANFKPLNILNEALLAVGFDIAAQVEGATIAELYGVQACHDAAAAALSELGGDFKEEFIARLRESAMFHGML